MFLFKIMKKRIYGIVMQRKNPILTSVPVTMTRRFNAVN